MDDATRQQHVELWRDRWCFLCHSLRRFAREEGVWRCQDCHSIPCAGVIADLNYDERTRSQKC